MACGATKAAEARGACSFAALHPVDPIGPTILEEGSIIYMGGEWGNSGNKPANVDGRFSATVRARAGICNLGLWENTFLFYLHMLYLFVSLPRPSTCSASATSREV